jgi:acyl carrier protein
MVPSIVMALGALPLTPNGKVDRNALPNPEVHGGDDIRTYVSPANALEAGIADIWQEVLKVERVGRSDNFFDLGGHSLLIVQVQSRLRSRLGTKVTLVELFQYPTVAELASFLTEGSSKQGTLDTVRERAARQRAVREIET